MNYFTVQCFFRPFLTLLLQIFLNYCTWLFLPFYQTSILPQHFKQFLTILFVPSFYITRRLTIAVWGHFTKFLLDFFSTSCLTFACRMKNLTQFREIFPFIFSENLFSKQFSRFSKLHLVYFVFALTAASYHNWHSIVSQIETDSLSPPQHDLSTRFVVSYVFVRSLKTKRFAALRNNFLFLNLFHEPSLAVDAKHRIRFCCLTTDTTKATGPLCHFFFKGYCFLSEALLGLFSEIQIY